MLNTICVNFQMKNLLIKLDYFFSYWVFGFLFLLTCRHSSVGKWSPFGYNLHRLFILLAVPLGLALESFNHVDIFHEAKLFLLCLKDFCLMYTSHLRWHSLIISCLSPPLLCILLSLCVSVLFHLCASPFQLAPPLILSLSLQVFTWITHLELIWYNNSFSGI